MLAPRAPRAGTRNGEHKIGGDVRRLDRGRLVLVGPGRAGLALVRSWTSAGGTVVLVARNASGAHRVRGEFSDGSVEVRSEDDERTLAGDILALAVPDDAIEGF